jgi:hypothetical protein
MNNLNVKTNNNKHLYNLIKQYIYIHIYKKTYNLKVYDPYILCIQ